MKKIIPFLSAVVFFTACNSKPSPEVNAAAVQTSPAPQPDTTGLAQYQEWKASHELVQEKPEQAVAAAPVRTVVRYQSRPVHAQSRAASRPALPSPVTQKQESSAPAAGNGNETATGTGNKDVATAGTGETETKEEKKGMSNATKGAVIGGAAGTAAGAVIFKKNRVVGGVVGGVIGAAVGYGVGKAKDKKEGK